MAHLLNRISGLQILMSLWIKKERKVNFDKPFLILIIKDFILTNILIIIL